jgi:hypothetical protein
MPDLTRGYNGGGKGNCAVLDAILKQAPLNVNLPALWLPQKLFTLNFMPYATNHWAYDGSTCNCEDLSNALCAVWDYVKSVKRTGGENVLPKAEKVSCLSTGDGLITKAKPVFAGPAKGNVRLQSTGMTDGRCLFPVHYICKIGGTYCDPTYNQMPSTPTDIVERELKRLTPGLFIAKDRSFLYARSLADPAPGFTTSWHEMKGAGWISSQDWKTKTARTMHTRSTDLQRVDTTLKGFEDEGASALDALKTAFRDWAARNPKETSSRNADNCVSGLATFLGVTITLSR